MTWGTYVQQGNLEEIERLGSQLSKEINCPVHYPAWNKNMFECKCNIIFPYYMVNAKDWDRIREIHRKGGRQE